MALVVLSVVEQRLDAAQAVLAGMDVTEGAARAGVHQGYTAQRCINGWPGISVSSWAGWPIDRSGPDRQLPIRASNQMMR